jgi:hypothetical protein
MYARVLFDASGGTMLNDLGDAIAIARSELNVEIDIDTSALEENKKRLAKQCCVCGTIQYPNGESGTLIYARSVVTRDAPYDVQALRLRDAAFPHHSTVDQLYSDQKFEAYRNWRAGRARGAVGGARYRAMGRQRDISTRPVIVIPRRYEGVHEALIPAGAV